jgi:putative acetyltransferase
MDPHQSIRVSKADLGHPHQGLVFVDVIHRLRQTLVDHEHDFGRLDDCGDVVSNLDAEILYALPGDDAFDEIFTHADRHFGCNYSKNNGLYLAPQLITRRYFHGSDCISLGVRMAERGKYEIVPARWPEDTQQALRLLTNYGRHLAASPVAAAGMCFADYEAQLRGLPGKYAAADADLLLAWIKGHAAGCAAITPRMLKDGAPAAELKRLWVEPQFRGYGVGRGLVIAAIDWAWKQGCRTLVLDTVNEAMPEASALYQSLGFEEMERFNDNPISGVRFYKLKLTGDK